MASLCNTTSMSEVECLVVISLGTPLGLNSWLVEERFTTASEVVGVDSRIAEADREDFSIVLWGEVFEAVI